MGGEAHGWVSGEPKTTGPAQVMQGVVFRRSKRPLDVPVDQNRARKWNLRVIWGLERSSGNFFRGSSDPRIQGQV